MSGEGNRKNVAVLFGGRSVEHEISIITGLQVIKAMDTLKYNPIPVYVSQWGKWYCGSRLLNRDFYKMLPDSVEQVQEVTLLPDPAIHGLTVVRNAAAGLRLFGGKKAGGIKGDVIPVDAYFLAFHGSYGEDGCIQGLLEMADAVYAGCDVTSSAVCMSKEYSKIVVASTGVPVLPAVQVFKNGSSGFGPDLGVLRRNILSGLEKFPLFIKPATLGSSIGVSRAANEPELDAALLKAFQYDTAAIVEPCLDNKLEINVSIMEDLNGGTPIASVVEIPVPSAGGELTYEDKYMRGGSKKTGREPSGMAGLVRVIDPQELDAAIKKQVQDYGVKAFAALRCTGVVRIDFMQDLDTGVIYFNEINPLPGSFAFYLWEKSNPPVLFTDIVSTMIESAEKRRRLKRALTTQVEFRALLK